MKKHLIVGVLALVLVLCSSMAFAAGFEVHRLVIAAGVENREPVGAADKFAASTDTVYCFIEALKIAEDTTMSFVWLHEGQEVAKVDANIKKGWRFRTFSSKKLLGLVGKWEVQIKDAAGNVVQTAAFTVE